MPKVGLSETNVFIYRMPIEYSGMSLTKGQGGLAMFSTAIRRGSAGIVLVLAVLSASGCTGIASKEINAERDKLRTEPVKMSAKGQPEASIDADGEVVLGERKLALSDAQRELVADYRGAVVDLVDLTLRETSKATRFVVARALFGMAVGRLDETTDKIERQAEGIAHTPEFCRLLGEVRQRQDRMVASIDELKPYAKVDAQDLADCRAGKQYQTGT